MFKINLSSLFLASDMNLGLAIGLIVGCFIVALGIGIFVGYVVNKKTTEKRLGDVQSRTKKMIEDASQECKALKKEARKRNLNCRNKSKDSCKRKTRLIKKKKH